MTKPEETCWLFIVDTDEYAGNCERPMVAWMTGAVGDCEVGHVEAERARADGVNLDESLIWLTDDHGCARPATIWPTPGWSNDGHGVHKKGPGKFPAYQSVACAFRDRPDDATVAMLAERAASYAAVARKFNEPGNILRCRLVHYVVTRKEAEVWFVKAKP